jgi:polysaccharide pyruvyl transferase WcaK-like protein
MNIATKPAGPSTPLPPGLPRIVRRKLQDAPKPARRIALLGLFGCGNFGNDGSLEAMLRFLRRAHPEAELSCICANPNLIRQRYGLATIPISSSYSEAAPSPDRIGRGRKLLQKLHDLVLTIKHMREFDVMIVPGTGILDDFGERPHGMPLEILRWFLGARLLGVKTALVSIGAGPIGHPVSRWLMKSAARVAHYRSYRDSMSKDFLTGIGLSTGGDPVYPDIAFSLPAPPVAKRRKGGRLTVGIGVMSYYGWYGFADGGTDIYARYIEKLSKFAIHLLDSGHRIRLMTGETCDVDAVDDLLRRVKEERPKTPQADLIAEPAGSLHDLMRQISLTDIVVATRYHNIVCALKLAKPSISLGYSKKNDVLMAQAGQGSYCHNVEQFEVDALIDQFAHLCALRHESENVIRAHGRIFEKRLAAQEAFLSAELLAGDRMQPPCR